MRRAPSLVPHRFMAMIYKIWMMRHVDVPEGIGQALAKESIGRPGKKLKAVKPKYIPVIATANARSARTLAAGVGVGVLDRGAAPRDNLAGFISLEDFMKTRLWLLPLALLAVPVVAHAQGGKAGDEKAIRNIETNWETAWNHHDVAAMTRLFAPDADVINLAGEWFKGRDAFAKSLEALHSAKVKESVWQTEETHIKFLTPGTVIVHVYFNSHGEKNPDGTPLPPRRGIFTRVEMKRNGEWRIAASQATKIVPPETASLIAAPHGNVGQ